MEAKQRKLWKFLNTMSVTPDKKHNAKNPVEDFTNKLTKIVKKCIPKNLAPYKLNRPWFDEEWRKATYLRWAALHKFKVVLTTSNLISYKQHRAKVHRIIKEAKINSEQNSIPLLNQKQSGAWSAKSPGNNNQLP